MAKLFAGKGPKWYVDNVMIIGGALLVTLGLFDNTELLVLYVGGASVILGLLFIFFRAFRNKLGI